MSETLNFDSPMPASIDARKVFRQAMRIEGYLPLSSMDRLLSLLIDADGHVNAVLTFAVDEGHRKRIGGLVQASVNVQCQRCLEPLKLQLSEPVDLALVSTQEKAKQLPTQIDPWLSDEDNLALADIVEEQLILCMPFVNMHENCQAAPIPVLKRTNNKSSNAADNTEAAEQTTNPFAVLASLKKPQD
jgi:uncharacterized protein